MCTLKKQSCERKSNDPICVKKVRWPSEHLSKGFVEQEQARILLLWDCKQLPASTKELAAIHWLAQTFANNEEIIALGERCYDGKINTKKNV